MIKRCTPRGSRTPAKRTKISCAASTPVGRTKSLEEPAASTSRVPKHIFGALLNRLPAPKVLGKALGTGIAVLYDRTEEFDTIAKCLLKPCMTKASLYLPLPELTEHRDAHIGSSDTVTDTAIPENGRYCVNARHSDRSLPPVTVIGVLHRAKYVVCTLVFG